MARRESISEKIRRDLRKQMIQCAWQAGELLTEIEISQRYECSKTPAREALNYLCMEGYLEKLPNKGYLVKAVSARELQQMMQYRYILEGAAAELAARYATADDIQRLEEICAHVEGLSSAEMRERYNELNRDFHLELARISRNPWLISAVANILDQLRRALTMDLLHMADPQQALKGHEKVVEAVRLRDQSGARQLAEEHLTHSQNRMFVEEGITC